MKFKLLGTLSRHLVNLVKSLEYLFCFNTNMNVIFYRTITMFLIQSKSSLNTCGLNVLISYFKYFQHNMLNESNYGQLSSYHALGTSNYCTTSVLIQDGNPVFLEFSFFFLQSLSQTQKRFLTIRDATQWNRLVGSEVSSKQLQMLTRRHPSRKWQRFLNQLEIV